MTDNNPSTALITTNEGGFGLIEVLISLLLLSVVALGLITVQGRLLVQTKHADLRLQAVQLMANDYHAVRSFTPEQKQIYIQTLQRIAQTAQSRSESDMNSYRIAAYATTIRCRPECHLNEQANLWRYNQHKLLHGQISYCRSPIVSWVIAGSLDGVCKLLN